MKVVHRQLGERERTGRRVVIVDDHESFRKCARTLLESEGFEVVGEAADGESAVALAAELSPDCVLLDIQLPDIDGFAVAERLLAADPQLQIVLVSSRDRSSYGPLIDKSGARGFLSKGDVSGVALERLLE
ncbi:MAG TPA: response regulator transcription factor [Gaiellaceae bacterium]|jgi:DNA-binding NarL/FixJ family response regulator